MGDEVQRAVETLTYVLDHAKEGFEPEIFGATQDGMVGFAMIAPDCVVMAYSLGPVPMPGCFFDFCLN